MNYTLIKKRYRTIPVLLYLHFKVSLCNKNKIKINNVYFIYIQKKKMRIITLGHLVSWALSSSGWWKWGCAENVQQSIITRSPECYKYFTHSFSPFSCYLGFSSTFFFLSLQMVKLIIKLVYVVQAHVWFVTWLAAETNMHGQRELCPIVPVELVLLSSVVERFLLCELRFSTYPM